MSALVVIFHRDGSPVRSGVLERMTAVLAEYGPDGCDQAVRNQLGIAHQHFWTTPEEIGERQPLTGSQEQYLLAFDGRLDNREELLASLAGESSIGEETSDARIVLAAYGRWGEHFCQRLVGPFALAIADRERRRVLLARDPLGDRSLFYRLTDRTLLAASEPSALLAHPEISADLNETRLACFFALRTPADGSTFFRDIRELLPGELMIVGQERVRRSEFWRPSPEADLIRASEADLADEFRHRLRRAVGCRLRASVPPAVMLSGGMDSTSAAALGAEELRNSGSDWRLRAVSWVFDEFVSCDERRFIDSVVQRWNLEALQVNGDDAIALAHRDALCQRPSTPEDNVYRELKRRVFSAAAQTGSRVVLNCSAADSLYTGGEGWFVDLVRAGSPAVAVFELIGEGRRWGTWQALRRTTLLRGLGRVKRGIMPPKARQMPWLRPQAERRVLAATGPRFNSLQGLRADQVEAVAGLWAAANYSLEYGYGMREGIELRDPYRDLRLVEFMLRVSAHQLYRRGAYKPIARRAMTGKLPDSVLKRTDRTLLTPLFEEGLRRRHRQAVEQLLASGESVWRQYVEPGWIEAALVESVGDAFDIVLWRCVSFELWRQRHSWGSTAPEDRLP